MKAGTGIIGLWLFWALTGGSFAGTPPSVHSLPELQKPNRMLAFKGRLFVADGTTIRVYSLSDFSLVNSFGKNGEGPGELKEQITALDADNDLLLVNSIARLSWFTPDGTFVRQQSDSTVGTNYSPLPKGFVGLRLLREKDGIYFTNARFDRELNLLQKLNTFPHPFFRGRGAKIDAVHVRISSTTVVGERIVLDHDGTVYVYDQEGRLLNSFTPDQAAVPVRDEDRQRILDFWKNDLKMEYQAYRERLVFPEYFPPIRDLLAEEGQIVILTYASDSRGDRVLKYSMTGEAMGECRVPLQDVNTLLPQVFSHITLHSGSLFVLREDPDGDGWVLHIHSLSD